MSPEPIPEADRRATMALITAVQSGDGRLTAGLLAELAEANLLAPVLFSMTAHYIGLVRTIAPMLGVSPEYMIRSAALSGENPPA